MLPLLQERQETLDYVFDVSTLLADDLSDEQRFMFARFESQRLSEPRIFFLLGSSPPADGWLGLVTSQAPVGVATSTSSSVGAPGRAGHSQPIQGASPAWNGPQPLPRPQPGQRPAVGSNQQKLFNPPVQYPLKRWELLPDQGSTGAINDTAISLSLFGARKAQ